jgi:hypothetical protein
VVVVAAWLKVPVPVYGDEPPEAVTVTKEVPPKHSTLVGLGVAVTLNADGCVMIILLGDVQLLASVTVTL